MLTKIITYLLGWGGLEKSSVSKNKIYLNQSLHFDSINKENCILAKKKNLEKSKKATRFMFYF